MNRTFDARILGTQLAELTERSALLFALTCAERTLPNYEQFVKITGWGNVAVLRGALDVAWQSLRSSRGIEHHAANLPEMKEACMLEAPYTEDFETMLVSAVLDAAIATVHIIEFLETCDRQLAIAVAKLARNTVDLVVQELDAMSPNAPDLEERIRTHVLMQNELYWQERSLAEVASDVDIGILESRWRSVPGSLPEINEDNLRFPRAVEMPKRLG